MLLVNECYNYKWWAQILILTLHIVDTQEILKTYFLTSLMRVKENKK